MIVGLSSGLAVLMQSFKYLSMKHLGTILIYTMPGAVIGTMMISYLASGLLIKLSIILIIWRNYKSFFSKYYYSKDNKTNLLILGGFIQAIMICRWPICFNGL